MASILITGASGFLGSRLVPVLLSRGHCITIISRNPNQVLQRYPKGVYVASSLTDLSLETGFDVAINLAGESIQAGRWSPSHKKAMRESRLTTTEALVRHALKVPIKHVIQASAIGYYGKQTQGPWPLLTESSPKGEGFLADLAYDWEQAAMPLSHLSGKLTRLRFAPIFAANGGAFPLIRLPYLFRAGAIIGDGHQPFPWIHRDDVVGAILHVMAKGEKAAPVYNVIAPECLSQRQSTETINAYLHQVPCPLSVPSWVFSLILGEKAQLIIGGQRAFPLALQKEGYLFHFPTLASALPRLFARKDATT